MLQINQTVIVSDTLEKPILTIVPELTTQPKPKTPKQQLLKPGDLVYSVCGGFVYEIRSYPVCRIYYDYAPTAKYLLSYHELENLSFEDKQKGLKHRHLSYLATVYNSTLRCNGVESLFYITDNGLRLIQK